LNRRCKNGREGRTPRQIFHPIGTREKSPPTAAARASRATRITRRAHLSCERGVQSSRRYDNARPAATDGNRARIPEHIFYSPPLFLSRRPAFSARGDNRAYRARFICKSNDSATPPAGHFDVPLRVPRKRESTSELSSSSWRAAARQSSRLALKNAERKI
jgi:hypothetical protein